MKLLFALRQIVGALRLGARGAIEAFCPSCWTQTKYTYFLSVIDLIERNSIGGVSIDEIGFDSLNYSTNKQCMRGLKEWLTALQERTWVQFWFPAKIPVACESAVV